MLEPEAHALDAPLGVSPRAPARIDDARVTYIDPATGWRAVRGERAPPFPKGNKISSAGRPPGASPRTALLRDLAANPDADGIGARAAELGVGIVDAARKLVELVSSGAPADEIKAAQAGLTGLVTWLDSVEPNVKRTERVEASQRVVLHLGGAPASGASEIGSGPIQDAPLPSQYTASLPPASQIE